MRKTLGGDRAGTSDRRDIPQHMTPCSARNAGGGGWQGLPLLRAWPGSGRLVVSNCFPLHALFFVGFSFVSVLCLGFC